MRWLRRLRTNERIVLCCEGSWEFWNYVRPKTTRRRLKRRAPVDEDIYHTVHSPETWLIYAIALLLLLRPPAPQLINFFSFLSLSLRRDFFFFFFFFFLFLYHISSSRKLLLLRSIPSICLCLSVWVNGTKVVVEEQSSSREEEEEAQITARKCHRSRRRASINMTTQISQCEWI